MKPPQKPDIISKALMKHRGKGLRSEELVVQIKTDYNKLFVDPNLIDNLINNTTQVIYGRTGSGKTHLLGTLEERIRQNFLNVRVLPFFFTAPIFRESPEGIYRWSTDREAASAYFRQFITILAKKFSNAAQNILYNGLVPWKLTKKSKKLNELENYILEIEDLLEKGLIYYPPTSTHISSKQTSIKENSGSIKHGAGVSVSIKPTSGLFEGDLGINSAITEGEKIIEDRKMEKVSQTEGIPLTSFYPLRDLLLIIINILELDYIVILIDEWPMGLDPTGSTSIQAYFGEMIKRTFLRTGKIAFKISTNWYQTSVMSSI